MIRFCSSFLKYSLLITALSRDLTYSKPTQYLHGDSCNNWKKICYPILQGNLVQIIRFGTVYYGLIWRPTLCRICKLKACMTYKYMWHLWLLILYVRSYDSCFCFCCSDCGCNTCLKTYTLTYLNKYTLLVLFSFIFCTILFRFALSIDILL